MSSSKEAKDIANDDEDHTLKRKLVNPQSSDQDTKRTKPDTESKCEKPVKVCHITRRPPINPITRKPRFFFTQSQKSYTIVPMTGKVKQGHAYVLQDRTSTVNELATEIDTYGELENASVVLWTPNPFLGSIYAEQYVQRNANDERRLMCNTESTSVEDEQLAYTDDKPLHLSMPEMNDLGLQYSPLLTSLFLGSCFMQMIHRLFKADEVVKEDFSSVPNRLFRIFTDSHVFWYNSSILCFVQMMRKLPRVLRGNQSLSIVCWKTTLTATICIALKSEENSTTPPSWPNDPLNTTPREKEHFVTFQTLLVYLAFVFGLDVAKLKEEEEYILYHLHFDLFVPHFLYPFMMYDFAVCSWKSRYELAWALKEDEGYQEELKLEVGYVASLICGLQTFYNGRFGHDPDALSPWLDQLEGSIFNKPPLYKYDSYPHLLSKEQGNTILNFNESHKQLLALKKKQKSLVTDTSPCVPE